MFIGALSPVSNRAGWTIAQEVLDEENDEQIDLSQATIVFEVRDKNKRTVLSASNDDGITIIDTGVFQVAFTRDQMSALCAGSYEVGCTIKNADEEEQQFIIGTLPVLDGVVAR